jgi:hypothetical protein
MLLLFNLYILEEMIDRKIALFFRSKSWKIIASFMEVAANSCSVSGISSISVDQWTRDS